MRGGEQQLVGAVINIFQPAVELEMKVYEVTEERPTWTIGLRTVLAKVDKVGGVVGAAGGGDHRSVQPGAEGLAGGEGGGWEPAGDGDQAAGGGERSAVRAGDARGGGQGRKRHGGSRQDDAAGDARACDGILCAVGGGGRALLRYAAPADTTLMAVYLPAGVKIEKSVGVEVGKPGGVHAVSKDQLLKGKGIKVGTDVVIELSGIVEGLKPANPTGAETRNPHGAQTK